MIEVRHLTKKYGNHVAVDDISFTVEPGKIYGFLGPNGAGKSTTLNIITGCLAPTDGEILIDGYSVMDEPIMAKRAVGYLPEVPPLYPDMTPEEYLRFVAEAKSVRRDKIAEQVEDVMASTGITEMRRRLIRSLSKGYKQRVGIAQAMIGDPDIIILDEPTEGLDPQQRAEIRELIGVLGRERTVILSSHVLSEVQEVCDNIIMISHGKLVANDSMENISHSFNQDVTMTLTVMASPEEVEAVLSNIEGIKSYEITSTSGSETSAKLRYSAELDLRENISFAFSDIRRAVVSMGVEEESLEEIFLRLTGTPETGAKKAADGDDADEDGGDEAENEDDTDDEDEDVTYDPADYVDAADGGDDDNDDGDDDDDDDDSGEDGGGDYKPVFGGK